MLVYENPKTLERTIQYLGSLYTLYIILYIFRAPIKNVVKPSIARAGGHQFFPSNPQYRTQTETETETETGLQPNAP
jgi:hypothetical protein